MLDFTKYETVAEVGEWDYEWWIGALLRDQEGNLFFVTDSGCSCMGFGENIGEADLIPVKNAAEAVEEAKKAGFSDSDVYEFAKRLMF